jgi:hypothetical protein
MLSNALTFVDEGDLVPLMEAGGSDFRAGRGNGWGNAQAAPRDAALLIARERALAFLQ